MAGTRVGACTEDGRSGQSPHLPSQKPLRRDLLLVLVYDRDVNPLFGVICGKSGLDPFLTLEFGVCHAVSLSPSSPCVGLRLTGRRGCEDQRPRSCGVRPLPGGAERTVGSPSRRPRGARGPSCVAALSVSRGTRRGERGRAGRAVLTASVWLTALPSLWRHHQGDHDEDETERQAAQRAVPAPVPAAGECLPAPRRGPHRGDTPPRHRCPSRPSRAHTPPPGHRAWCAIGPASQPGVSASHHQGRLRRVGRVSSAGRVDVRGIGVSEDRASAPSPGSGSVHPRGAADVRGFWKDVGPVSPPGAESPRVFGRAGGCPLPLWSRPWCCLWAWGAGPSLGTWRTGSARGFRNAASVSRFPRAVHTCDTHSPHRAHP